MKDQDFFYLLLGKMSSDPIEARFGAYRQMAGANYYISCKQLFEAEKKIRALNLIKSHVDLSNWNFHALDQPLNEVLSESSFTDLNFDEVGFEDIDGLDAVEQATVFYVAGYVGRSISRRNKCKDCKSLLVESDEEITVHDKDLLLSDLNRGGLSSPSDFCYTICIVSFIFYKQLHEANRRRTFLCAENQQAVFLSNVLQKLPSIFGLKVTFNRRCAAGHILLKLIINCIFNCFAKNLKRKLNTNNEMEKQSRKLLKLKSV